MLAATLSPSYGIYSGYEHFENVPVREGSEEYLDSEKYEVRERALDGPLLPMIRRLNEIRHENPALQVLSNVFWLETQNDGPDRVRQAAPRQLRSSCRQPRSPPRPGGRRDVIPAQLGLPPAFAVEDLLTGEHYDWRIGANYVRLDPHGHAGPRPPRAST